MNYGLPYKGSKNKLAEQIISFLPKAEHLIDLFAGGCAVSHCAILKGKYPHVHANDINAMMPQAFVKALNGGFDNETRWISREDFFRLKDSDPYAAIYFSFGNDLRTYAYGRNIEQEKKALHYAVVLCEFGLSDEIFGVDLRPIESITDRQQRYFAAKRILTQASKQITPPYKLRNRFFVKAQQNVVYKA